MGIKLSDVRFSAGKRGTGEIPEAKFTLLYYGMSTIIS
jgi:hypothetical protein